MKSLPRVLALPLALLLWLCSLSPGAALAQDGKKSEYLLGAGDSIRITVFQNPDLTVETRVSENGSVTYPLIGAMALGGHSLGEAEGMIAAKLRRGGFVRQPQVNIVLLQIRGNQVSVLGLVNRPGRYPIETFDTRLTDMLATAGGIAPTGADTVVFTGMREGKPFRQEIDIPSLFLAAKAGVDREVAGGDAIYVHRAPVFYIYGEVQRAGAYRLEREMTVLQGLAQGGGLTPRGTERGVRVHRRGPDGHIQVIDPKMDQRLQADDVIYIQESLF
ncbi:MAG: polysaccharide export protein EpsE [Rhodocyclaceae bacterium]|nr:polysaccharide export protein EpsE [Rhodocyclaceae bacterium]